jgi:hypothetical protein
VTNHSPPNSFRSSGITATFFRLHIVLRRDEFRLRFWLRRGESASSISVSKSTHLVSKLWNYCSILRDDGLSYAVADVQRRPGVVEELEAVVSANVRRATPFRQSILQRTFSGVL